MNTLWARLAALGAVVVTVVALSITELTGGGDADRVEIKALFADASPLVQGSTVRVAGVEVGKVTAITPNAGKALVTMSVDRNAALPLHSDATAKIRPVSLLGERFVELRRGGPTAATVPSQSVIQVNRTSSSVELSDILSSVDEPTGTALAAMITTLGEGTQGGGKQINAALRALAPALRDADKMLRMLDEQNAVLTDLIDRTQPVAASVGADGGRNLDRMLDSSERLLAATTADKEAFEATLQRFPRTLTSARQALRRLARVSEAGESTLGSVRPFTDRLPRTSRELNDFSSAAQPALDRLDPVLARGSRLLEQAAPLVRALRPAGEDLRAVSASARPITRRLTANLRDVLGFIRNWSLASNGHDGVSHYFRGVAILDPSMITGRVPKTVPARGGEGAAKLPEVPRVPSLSDSVDPGNVTGLSPQQEKSLVGQLLGGR